MSQKDNLILYPMFLYNMLNMDKSMHAHGFTFTKNMYVYIILIFLNYGFNCDKYIILYIIVHWVMDITVFIILNMLCLYH